MPPSSFALGTLFALGVVRACAAPPPAHSAGADPHTASSSPAALPTNSAVPAASNAVVAAAPPALPLVTAAVASDDDKLAFLRQVCEVAVHRDKTGKTDALGCACCPPFEEHGCPPKPPTRTVKSAADAVSRLDTLVLGSFTRAGADEAAASFQGCESHAQNYGGTALYGHVLDARASWKPLQYLSGFHPDACVGVRGTDGRDRLVCDRSDAHQTTGERYLLTHDFTEPDFADADVLAIVMHDDNCIGATMLPAGWPMVQAGLHGYEMAMRDGKPALVAHVDFAKLVPDKRYLTACAKAIRTGRNTDFDAAQALLPPPQPGELVFAFDGSTFKLASSSAALKKDIDTAFDRGP